jgi:hypothetical protein
MLQMLQLNNKKSDSEENQRLVVLNPGQDSVVRHTLRISMCVSERTHLLQ